MDMLQRRAEHLAQVERRRVIARIARELSARLNHVDLRFTDGSVELRGRGLFKRWLLDSSLRFTGSLIG